MEAYSIFWFTWFLILILGFAIVEGAALYGKRRKYDTLTQNIQWAVRLDRKPWWRIATACAWVGFASWFLWHIWID